MSSRSDHDLWLENRFIRLPQEVLDEGSIEGLTAFMFGFEEDLRDYTFVLHLAVDVSLDFYHPEFVNFILSQGADCNKSDKRGFTPLHYAVLRSNTAAAETLIKAGADVNLQVKESTIRDQYHRHAMDAESFPLHMATTTQLSGKHFLFLRCKVNQNWAQPFDGPQNLDLIKLLLSSGANCNALDGQGLAPLHYAVAADDMSAADILLEAGADVNIQSATEMATPLFCVVSVKMLCFLLSKDADQTILGAKGDTVLFHLIYSKMHKLSLAWLSDSSETRVPSYGNTSAFTCAFRQMNETSFKILINSGYDPRPEDLTPRTPSSSKNAPEVLKFKEAVRQVASNPRRLFDLCRFKIRNILKTNIRNTVLDLPLPEHLRGAICMKDVAQDLNLADD